jgi:hypothetical protein
MCLLLVVRCAIKGQQPVLTNKDVSKVIARMTDVMVHDVTNPPLASRFFAYTCLAGYEVMAQNDKQLKSMHGVLNQYPVISAPKQISDV